MSSPTAHPAAVRAAVAPSAIYAEQLFKSYDEGAIPVLKGVSFEARARESVALCGPSGCGKSTLLHILGGLDIADQGRVLVNGQQVKRTGSTVQMLRHQVGFVFQLHNLLADLTLEENCLLPTVAAGTSRAQAEARLTYLTGRTGLSHRLHQRMQKLSGGERQRTALCRALMNRPGILLADEPTGSLDEGTAEQVFSLLLDLTATEGITLVMATHDRSLASRCDRMLDMRDGKFL